VAAAAAMADVGLLTSGVLALVAGFSASVFSCWGDGL